MSVPQFYCKACGLGCLVFYEVAVPQFALLGGCLATFGSVYYTSCCEEYLVSALAGVTQLIEHHLLH